MGPFPLRGEILIGPVLRGLSTDALSLWVQWRSHPEDIFLLHISLSSGS